MIKTGLFIISRLGNNTCKYLGIKYDTTVDPLIFLLNFHKACHDNKDFTYLTFYDLLDELYCSDKEKFYKRIAHNPDCISTPLGYDGRQTICSFHSTMGSVKNPIDLTSTTFTPFLTSIYKGDYNFSSYLYDEEKDIKEELYSQFNSIYLDNNYPDSTRQKGDITKGCNEFRVKYSDYFKNLKHGTYNLFDTEFTVGVEVSDINIIKEQFKNVLSD